MKKKIIIISLSFFLVILLIFIIIKSSFFGVNKNDVSYYSSLAITEASEHNLNLKKMKYSKTLEEILIRKLYNEKHLKVYLKTSYIDHDYFINYLNYFLDLGYDGLEIENIFNLSINNIVKLKDAKKININKYYKIKNFNVDNAERYASYEEKNQSLSIEKVITYVNLNMDIGFYKKTEFAKNLDTLHVIVNKNKQLHSDYIPKNIVNVLGVQMVKEAADALVSFISAAKNAGYNFRPTSAYRNYAWQRDLYNKYKNESSPEEADTYSARAGHSEHQTGLAVDLANETYSQTSIRITPVEYQWILNNSYKYGFIIRYPANSSHITGYQEENWHIRYLGKDLAKKIVDSNLTFDEYYDIYLEDY